MKPFTIMVDTNCDLPAEYMAKHSITSIPIAFDVDGVQHEGGRWQEITDKEYYEKLRKGSVSRTALANQESFIQLFTEFAERDDELLIILLSSGLSGTYENSAIALDEVKKKYPDCKIRALDSINAAGGSGVVTALAVNKRDQGLSLTETADWLEEKKHSCIALFTVDDLMYLHRGGRLSKIQAVAGSIIGIKPLLNVAPDGTLKLKEKARGRKGALERLCSQMKRSLNADTELDKVIISHSDCIADANTLAEMIKSSMKVNEIIIEMMGPVIGAHVGPGCIALFYEADMKRTEYEAKFYG